MSKRLCVCGLLLVLLVGGTPLLAQPPQADKTAETASWWTTLLSDWLDGLWLDGLLSVGASGAETGSPPVDVQPTTETPQTQLQSPASLTEEDGATTESGPGIEPEG